MRKDKFGSSSEKTSRNEVEGQLSIFNEAEIEARANTEEPIKKRVDGYYRKNPRTKREELIKDLPVREVLCDILKEDCYCIQCETALKAIGQETVREELEYIPAKLQIVLMGLQDIINYKRSQGVGAGLI